MIKRICLFAALLLAVTAGRLLAQEVHSAAPVGEHAAASSVEHGAAAEHEEPGLLPNPTDPQTWYAALWVVVIFAVMLIILYPTAWKNVLAGLKAREERIRKDIADAEAARAKADATLKQYNTQLAAAEDRVRQMLNQAAADGEKLATSIRMKAQADAEDIKERATKDIEAARDAALREIYEKTAELATNVAEKIIRRNLNASDQQDLVRQSLEQLQGVK
ncbi:MAG TPA: F0F1 ATP synthase subunit B [Tepidisphaeraceae bacterium]|nr:F0F1 ATP synthase subunit B [Tepidisphaeraceae bacterium]